MGDLMSDDVFEQGRQAATALLEAGVVDRIWRRDPTVWADASGSQSPEVAAAIGQRLGWLTAASDVRPHIPRVRALADALRGEGRQYAILLGMGGSSLCAEVLRQVYGVARGYLSLQVLDTTDAAAIHDARQRADPMRTIFVVASKSGKTVEVAALERFFSSELARGAGRKQTGRAFVGISDPGTPLVALAGQHGYREIFLNPADIGGRFSVLSLFGLVPAALLGVDLEEFLAAAEAMAEGCRQQNHTNPGLELGALIGAAALAGRDKLTVILPPSLSAFGLWVEQLVAESTGKSGTGILPIVDEPIGDPSSYGNDRVFVVIHTDQDEPSTPTKDWADAVAAAGHPVMHLSTRVRSLGAEFFRWEFAVAVAGAVLHVNPFDEPNVKEAQDRTRELLEAFGRERRLPEDPTASADGGVSAFGATGPAADGAVAALRELFQTHRPGDYVAMLSYVSPLEMESGGIADVRLAIRHHTRAATTFGLGPRYLHSTGQYHKGGPDTGIFILITSDDSVDVGVPGMPYSFGVLKRAQALGDVQALRDKKRRIVRLHLDASVTDPRAAVRRVISEALTV